MKNRRNRGITLVALVLTIIILVILSGITLSSLTGKTGIITKAQIAKNEYEVAMLKENISLWYMENNLKQEKTDPVKDAIGENDITDEATLEKIVEFQNEAESTENINFSCLYYLDLEKLGIKGDIKENRYFMDVNTKIIYINEGIVLNEGQTYILEEKEILPVVLNSRETENGFGLEVILNLQAENVVEYEFYINDELYKTTKDKQIEVEDKLFGEYTCFAKAINISGEKYSSAKIEVENYTINRSTRF